MTERPDPLEPPPGYGKPGGGPVTPPPDPLQKLLDRATGGVMARWLNDAASRLEDGRCTAFASIDSRCQASATHWLWVGCENEHIDRSGVCGTHAVMFGRAGIPWRCQRCFEATGQVIRAKVIKTEPMEPSQ